jgi:transposase
MTIVTVGLDIAKQIFQAHGVDRSGKAVLRKRLRRAEVALFFAGVESCLIGLEASGGRTTGFGY